VQRVPKVPRVLLALKVRLEQKVSLVPLVLRVSRDRLGLRERLDRKAPRGLME
jgi:hypothetical protein